MAELEELYGKRERRLSEGVGQGRTEKDIGE